VLGHLDGTGDPDVALAEDELDQPGHHAHARGAADHLRMAHQVEEAALLVGALEFLLPDLEDVLLAPDPVADRGHRAEAEEGEVVGAPRGRQLDQLAVRRPVAVGEVGVHEVGVVDEAVLAQQAHRVRRGIGRGCARAARTDVQDLPHDVQRPQQQRLFLLDAARHEEGLLVQVAVVAHLVAAPHDLTTEVGIALDDPARNEPARLDAVAIEDLEDPRRAGLRAVGAHRHVQRPLGQRGVAVDPRALAVQVERDGERAPLALRPRDRLRLHARLP
jgi:hypothetical protein